ncbi:uncharacterized protein LOC114436429 isoform X2 [Parambassis ranga]|uniref:Uncharacterized protein LOC114436429 isoform X2 n=1 Tax=Parambassis ranga TaxID=210632 RepID=A0A6P7I3H1_9TELE|nr:uncharacterized protein LOC114436429 isoform X2 [Parambassis ranga]
MTGMYGPPQRPLDYHAEEHGNITVEWRFAEAAAASITISSLKIHCLLLPDLVVFYHLDNSVEEEQHVQFAGRVQCDKDALTYGKVRLHLPRVRTSDSGKYLCRMATQFGKRVKEFSLNVTAATVRSPPATADPTQPESRERLGLYAAVGLAAAAAAAALILVSGLVHFSDAAPEDTQSEDVEKQCPLLPTS